MKPCIKKFEIPSEWKNANGMENSEEWDIAPDGYTWIEKYVNDWTESQNKPSNPEITVEMPAVATSDKTQDKTNKKGFWTVINESESVR